MYCNRIQRGKYFSYTDATGNLIKDKDQIAYFKSLVIPPAWNSVEINTSPKAKIWATGYDIKGRKQYLYNLKFRRKQDAQKFDRLINFGEQLDLMRQTTAKHLRKRKLCKKKVLAAMLRLMEIAYFRPGNELYTKNNKSFGLTTLKSKHLKVKGNELIFTYKGKSNKMQEKHLSDTLLVNIVKQLDAIPGKEIFKFIDDDNKIKDVKSKHLNEYIHQVMGTEFSAKYFRTWGGSLTACQALNEMGRVADSNSKIIKKNINEAVKIVSEKLGNTPAIARNSYIDPRIFDYYIAGKTLSDFQNEAIKLQKKHTALSADEVSFLCMLQCDFKTKK